MKNPKMMHVDRVHHDGSGTVVTGIDLSECEGADKCPECSPDNRPLPVRIRTIRDQHAEAGIA